MARINRTDIIQKAVNDLALSTSTDVIPNQTLDKVQLVYQLNKNFSSVLANGNSTATGTITATMPTVDARAEIYLTGIDAGFIKDATCDLATGQITIACTPDAQGISKTIVSFSTLTLTAQDGHLTYCLPYPLKLKVNTNVTMTGTFSVGAMSRSLTVMGYVTSTN